MLAKGHIAWGRIFHRKKSKRDTGQSETMQFGCRSSADAVIDYLRRKRQQ